MTAKPHLQPSEQSDIQRRLRRTPSLARSLEDPDWWDDALDAASRKTGIADLPTTCPWGVRHVLDGDWSPSR
jgi:hypothetical protein